MTSTDTVPDVATAPSSSGSSRQLLIVATASVFLSASLLFAVQPLFARLTLPLLGGAPGVWTTALAFYQTALVAGYLYADRIARLGTVRQQAWIHAAVLGIAAIVALPLGVTTLLGSPPSGAPIPWLLGVFTLSVGAPFIALAATAPLVQAWVARAAPDANPYPLYAASNAGSFISLLSYPFIIEPLVGADAQRWGWSVGFLLAGAVIVSLGLMAARRDVGTVAAAASTPTAESDVAPATPARPVTWLHRLVWAGCAFAPSLLLAGVTSHIATDVASGPFLWVIPLALYLLTFVIAFADRQILSVNGMILVRAVGIFGLALMIATKPDLGWAVGLGLHLLVFVVAALTCHMELARRRPDPVHLTTFYLWMSIGGAFGGIFAGLIAPNIFNDITEYPLALIACLLVAPWAAPNNPRAWAAIGVVIVSLGVFIAVDQMRGYVTDTAITVVAIGIAMCALLALRSPPVLAAFAAAIFALSPIGRYDAQIVVQDRSFFGVLRVKDDQPWRTLTHGTTLHGVQSLLPERQRDPLSYYAEDTPLGGTAAKLAELKPNAKVGIVGLGAGSIACFATPDQRWNFFEIDPAVIRLSKEDGIFTFLDTCAPQADVIEGDARLTLANEPEGTYDYLLIDAFSSDMVPAHLLTREALNLYISRLAPGGIAVLHISNRYMALTAPVVAGTRANGHAALVGRHVSYYDQRAQERYYDSSSVLAVMIARKAADLEPYFGTSDWSNPEVDPRKAWTDDYANLLDSIIAARRGEE